MQTARSGMIFPKNSEEVALLSSCCSHPLVLLVFPLQKLLVNSIFGVLKFSLLRSLGRFFFFFLIQCIGHRWTLQFRNSYSTFLAKFLTVYFLIISSLCLFCSLFLEQQLIKYWSSKIVIYIVFLYIVFLCPLSFFMKELLTYEFFQSSYFSPCFNEICWVFVLF